PVEAFVPQVSQRRLGPHPVLRLWLFFRRRHLASSVRRFCIYGTRKSDFAPLVQNYLCVIMWAHAPGYMPRLLRSPKTRESETGSDSYRIGAHGRQKASSFHHAEESPLLRRRRGDARFG